MVNLNFIFELIGVKEYLGVFQGQKVASMLPNFSTNSFLRKIAVRNYL